MKNVVVYTMKNCPYCVAAKQLLTRRGIKFEEILVREDDDAKWEELYKISGMKTMPQIFQGKDLVGGYTELTELDSQDELKSLK